MKPKHLITITLLILVIIAMSFTATQAQGPVISTIGDPAVYGPADEIRALDAQAAAIEAQVIALFNAERARNRLTPLVHNKFLTIAAQGHSNDMAAGNFVSHTGSNGSSPWERIPAAGYTCSLGGEDVAAGQTDPASVVQAWLNSPGHRAIINGAYRSVGIGWTYKAGTTWGNFWTADFGGTPGQLCPGDDSNPGPVLTATPTRFVIPTATPFIPYFTPTPFRTATPQPPQPGNGSQIIIFCDPGPVNCRVVAWGPR